MGCQFTYKGRKVTVDVFPTGNENEWSGNANFVESKDYIVKVVLTETYASKQEAIDALRKKVENALGG